MLSVNDIRKIFGCGKNRAYAIMNTNGFPKIQIGCRYYIPQKAFEKWVENYTFKEYHLDPY